MALKALMLKKKIDEKRKSLDELNSKMDEFAKRELDLEKAIEEAKTDEEKETVEKAIDEFEKEKADGEAEKASLENEIEGLEGELKEEEKEQEVEEPQPEEKEERKEIKKMETRKFFNMNNQERDMFFAREDVNAYLTEVRSAIKEKRALTNVGLTIPEVFLGLIRENVMEYSKLYRHLNVRAINGEGRAIVMGTIPEAVWTDCCANLNELDLNFGSVELDCWKLGGFFAVCNANLEDSDVALATELVIALGQAIGLALDKAVLYGTGTRMPLGIVTRLVQTKAPADYPATAPTWTDLHTTNVVTIPAGTTGAELMAEIAMAFANAKGAYSRGEKVFAMNEGTYSKLVASAIEVDASGAIVSGVNGSMPVLGGIIEVLNFIPDNVIIGGYYDVYLLAERAGQRFATSEHVRFLQDQTVFKGTARYDGTPIAAANSWVAIGLDGTTPTAQMTFAADNANQGA